jgi:hypothetical protein
LNGSSWDSPVAQGRGTGAVTDIVFPPTATRFVRITQTGSVEGLYWSIHELRVLAMP